MSPYRRTSPYCDLLLWLCMLSSAFAQREGPGMPGMPGQTSGGKVCGVSAQSRSAAITTTTYYRIMTSNSCLGYNWKGSFVVNNATMQSNVFKVPLNPVITTSTTTVGVGGCAFGSIGFALNGIPFFSDCDGLGRDALLYEGGSFDPCGGHPTRGGQYHYHITPGCSNPRDIYKSRNNNFTYCKDAFWKEPTNPYSPLIGFMADGIPIYGPAGKGGMLPTDLDSCNGHVGDGINFSYYHTSNNKPYTVACLKGCVA
eukprot:TRINITY_DN3359_c0_g1_i3.p1 TRINITY_DN3359_c0_g1~~TRINITY_DN3359_c0_g1_i3.p1  ORF type:complete len:256 (+),score=17.63 TRINITY_DN3359_c0_g1_i3:86-853(+)